MNQYNKYINNIETNISLHCNRLTLNNKIIFYFYRIITSTADWWMYIVYAIFLLLITDYNIAINAIIFGTIAYLFHYPVYYLIKNTTKRRRPFDQNGSTIKCFVKPPDKYSLPSGHASCTFISSLITMHVFDGLNFLIAWPIMLSGFAVSGLHLFSKLTGRKVTAPKSKRRRNK